MVLTRLRTLTLALLAVSPNVLQPSTAPAQAPSKFANAADSLRKLVESGFVPSVAFSVANRSGVVYEDAFGYANRERRTKATPRTAYPVASVAKSYTAIGALRAVDARRLDLDATANSYLGRDSIAVPDRTLREACTSPRANRARRSCPYMEACRVRRRARR